MAKIPIVDTDAIAIVPVMLMDAVSSGINKVHVDKVFTSAVR